LDFSATIATQFPFRSALLGCSVMGLVAGRCFIPPDHPLASRSGRLAHPRERGSLPARQPAPPVRSPAVAVARSRLREVLVAQEPPPGSLPQPLRPQKQLPK